MSVNEMTFFELQKQCERRLLAAGVASPAAEARSIIAEAAGKMPMPDAEADGKAFDFVEKVVTRRMTGEPLQYILNKAFFRELELFVAPGVLIPRPETELLAGFFIDELPPNSTLLDLGTGSGAIALSAAYERKDLKVTAVDISCDALAIARKNAVANGLEKQVEFIKSDLFSALTGRRFAGIAANLPYVTSSEYASLPGEVKDFEPEIALVSGDDGLTAIKRSIAALPEHLLPGGIVAFELSPHQAKTAANELQKTGFFTETVCDLTGRERFVRGVFR